MTVNPNNIEQDIQNYINNYCSKIQGEYAQAQKYISQIEYWESQIANEESKIAWDKAHSKHWINEGGYAFQTTDHSVTQDMKGREAMVNGYEHILQTFEELLVQIDPGVEDMINAINSLLASIAGLTGKNISGAQMQKDLAQIQGYMGQMFQALEDRLQADKYLALIQQGGANGDLTAAELEKLAAEMLKCQGAEMSVLTNLINQMSNDVLKYHQQYDNANVDKNKFNWFDRDEVEINKDKQTMTNAKAMVNLIDNAIAGLIPEVASLSPEFVEIQFVLDQVIKDVEKIIANAANLSPKEMQGQILALMMFVLGFFSMVQQDGQGAKSKNEQLMSQANLDASEMNMEDIQMNTKIAAEVMENAKIDQDVMFAMKIVIGVLFTLLAPGWGSALVMLALLALSVSGGPQGPSVLDKLTDKIAEKTGKTNAEIIVTAVEVVASVAGGAGLDMVADQVASQVTQAAVKSAMQSVQSTIENTVEQALSTAGKVGDQAATQAVTDTLTQTVEQAAQKAAQTTFKLFVNQSVTSQIQMFAQGTFKQLLEDSVNQAANSAANNAVTQANLLLQTAAENGVAASEKEIANVASQAASKAVADVAFKSITSGDPAAAAQKSLNAATKACDDSTSAVFKTAATRLVASAVYGFTSNNLLLDSVIAIMKKEGLNQDDKAYEEIQMITQVLQSLISMIAMMGGTGMFSSLSTALFEGTPQALSRVINLFQALPQGARSIAQLGLYQVEEAQANATKGLQLASTISELLQLNLSQMTKAGQLQLNNFIQQQQQEFQSDLILANSLEKGDSAGIQVLVQAV